MRGNVYFLIALAFLRIAHACSNGQCKLLDECSIDGDCAAGLYCSSCPQSFSGSRCVRTTITDQFKLLADHIARRQKRDTDVVPNKHYIWPQNTLRTMSLVAVNVGHNYSCRFCFNRSPNNSLPFNKYAFLTTHNAFAIDGYPSHTGVPRFAPTNQEDSITQQLSNGVRALMLDTYDFEEDIWLCHSYGGECHSFTAFGPALDFLKEIETFLASNPSEIVTLILEDYVQTPNGLTKVFTDAGLMKYWFPVSNMPQSGQDWPLVSDMVAKNQRLLVFTSKQAKQDSEGIAYQWNFMVENQYGNDGMRDGSCPNRAESSPMDDKTKSLVLVNYFYSVPVKALDCKTNSGELINMLHTCYGASANRWANFVTVDYYKRSDGGGSFQATDMMNGELLCGCDDVHTCVPGSTSGACTPP